MVMSVNENDVLLGRGLGCTASIGNQRFLSLVNTRKDEYCATRSNKRKKEISLEVYNEIKRRGGRFLAPAETWQEGDWVEASEDVAIEKAKQALRSNKTKRKGQQDDTGDVAYESSETSGERLSPFAEAEQDFSLLLSDLDTPPASEDRSAVVDTNDNVTTLNFTSHTDLEIQSFSDSLVYPMGLCSLLPVPSTMVERFSSVDSRLLLFEGLGMGDESGHEEAVGDKDSLLFDPNDLSKDSVVQPLLSISEPDGVAPPIDNTTLESLLVMLGVEPHAPRFTEQDEELERELMTDEERMSVLADTFGKMCTVSSHKRKKARRNLDRDGVVFLLQQMKMEIVKIPADKKQALLAATTKCLSDEFDDDRLEVFLRSQGMNAKLAAERFIDYWECRKSIFGDNYTLPMTLNGALRDDIVALETGAYQLLPHPDSSGRRILLAAPHHHTRQGYTTESLIRVFWFYVELIVRDPSFGSSGFVHIVNDKDFTLFDYDRELDLRVSSFIRRAWPIKPFPVHFCTHSGLLSILKPFINATLGKEMRSRLVIHNVPEDKLIDSLAEYGITRDILPTSMGGRVVSNQADWIANQRAKELSLEEI